MSWYDPTSWSGSDFLKGQVLGGPIGGIANAASGGSIWNSTLGDDPGADQERQRKQLLYQQAGAAGGFADQQQGAFVGNQQQAQANIAALQAQANGGSSVSAEQLRQGLQQNLAAQRSLAAGAAPQNAAGAARTAAIQSARLGAGMAGQQAIAGLQERNQAQQALTGAIQGYGQQALSATQGARGQAIQGYGAGNAGTPEKSWIEKYGPAISSAAGLAAKSDRRAKTDIEPGDDKATKMLDGLRAFSYRYKNAKEDGDGEQLGVMAQDLERAGLKQAVIDTPGGKYLNGGKLAGANTAMIAALHRRLAKVEARANG